MSDSGRSARSNREKCLTWVKIRYLPAPNDVFWSTFNQSFSQIMPRANGSTRRTRSFVDASREACKRKT
jgi:hypothetical protein